MGAPALVEVVAMAKNFVAPRFVDGDLEFRYDEGEVCIYATRDGLEHLIEFCQRLINNRGNQHIHLEDYQVLTKESLRGTIAVFFSEEARLK
jgi:hypothetical protein